MEHRKQRVRLVAAKFRLELDDRLAALLDQTNEMSAANSVCWNVPLSTSEWGIATSRQGRIEVIRESVSLIVLPSLLPILLRSSPNSPPLR